MLNMWAFFIVCCEEAGLLHDTSQEMFELAPCVNVARRKALQQMLQGSLSSEKKDGWVSSGRSQSC